MRVDERFAVSRYTGTDVEQTLAAYNRFDASVHWQLNAQTQLGLSLENLADEDYYTDIGFPASGQLAKLNLRLNF
jgi:outer membrane receptor protein involved in Fe transport